MKSYFCTNYFRFSSLSAFGKASRKGYWQLQWRGDRILNLNKKSSQSRFSLMTWQIFRCHRIFYWSYKMYTRTVEKETIRPRISSNSIRSCGGEIGAEEHSTCRKGVDLFRCRKDSQLIIRSWTGSNGWLLEKSIRSASKWRGDARTSHIDLLRFRLIVTWCWTEFLKYPRMTIRGHCANRKDLRGGINVVSFWIWRNYA